MCACVCIRELERIVKEQEEKRQQEEMKRVRDEELKKFKTKNGGKKDNKDVSKKKNLLEGKQVCICIPVQQSSIVNQNTCMLP